MSSRLKTKLARELKDVAFRIVAHSGQELPEKEELFAWYKQGVEEVGKYLLVLALMQEQVGKEDRQEAFASTLLRQKKSPHDEG